MGKHSLVPQSTMTGDFLTLLYWHQEVDSFFFLKITDFLEF